MPPRALPSVRDYETARRVLQLRAELAQLEASLLPATARTRVNPEVITLPSDGGTRKSTALAKSKKSKRRIRPARAGLVAAGAGIGSEAAAKAGALPEVGALLGALAGGLGFRALRRLLNRKGQ